MYSNYALTAHFNLIGYRYTMLTTQLVPGQYHQTTIEVMEGIEELKPGQYEQKLTKIAGAQPGQYYQQDPSME